MNFAYWIRRQSLILALVSVVVAGCSGANAAKVSGIVTLDGSPMSMGDVSFYPEGYAEAKGGAPAYGQIASQGSYKLSTGTSAGLAPGAYIAVVIATKPPPQAYDARGEAMIPIPITPKKYRNVATSDLRIEVKAGANNIPLALLSDDASRPP